MGKLALVGLSTALGTTLGAVGVLAGQRIGFLPPPETPGDPWATTPAADRAAFDPAVAEAPIGAVSTATPGGPVRGTTRGTTEPESQSGPLRYLTVGEVAELLGVATAQLEKDAGLPEPDATVGRTRGWLESTVERYVGDRLARGAGGAGS